MSSGSQNRGIFGQRSQLQATRQKNLNYTARHGEDMNKERKSAKSKADFVRAAGIGPELAEFVTEFVEKPDHFYSIPFEKRREIENQMDAVLLSFEQW